jgi:hypothetical protein
LVSLELNLLAHHCLHLHIRSDPVEGQSIIIGQIKLVLVFDSLEASYGCLGVKLKSADLFKLFVQDNDVFERLEVDTAENNSHLDLPKSNDFL